MRSPKDITCPKSFLHTAGQSQSGMRIWIVRSGHSFYMT